MFAVRSLKACWLVVLAMMAALPLPAAAAPAIAWGAQPRYAPGFSHFEYANPKAPKGGTVNLDGFGSYDKLNPFTLKGIVADGLTQLMFETLAEGSDDEPASMYGLLAEDMVFAPDELSITFRLNPKARFSNGDPVLAEDVKHSFDTLLGKGAHPRYRQFFADVARAVVLDERTVRFEFKRRNHELHMIIGTQMPVFSRKWGLDAQGKPKPFDKIVQDEPITSGPYRVLKADWGKSISFQRNPAYWGAALAVRAGAYNFDTVVFRYYKDETARLEAFKAGEFDWIAENSAKNWARGHTGRRYGKEIVKVEFRHANAAGMQGFVLNTRRPQFADVRVRQALGLAFDFEWMNRQVFFGQYTRSPSYFTNSDMQATGMPSASELALLEPYRGKLSAEVFGPAVTPAVMDQPTSLRENLRKARALLEAAGWKVAEDGKLRNARGEAFSFEVLSYSKALERIAVPWVRNLEKLGIEGRMRVTDPALYQKRGDEFDFDVLVNSYSAGQTPGNELVERFTSRAAQEKGSDNLAGIQNEAVDQLIDRLLQSRSREEVVNHARALDRVLRAGYYLVPHFHSANHRVAYWKKLRPPEKLPLYYSAKTWFLKYWWLDPAAATP